MTVSEKVIAGLADLPSEQQTVVLDFVEFLRQKQQSAISLATTNTHGRIWSMIQKIVIDTGPLIAYFNSNDTHHA